MNLQNVMPHTTLRHMSAAQKLWRTRVGPDGPAFQDAIAEGDMEALAAIVAAKLDITVDAALDLELDQTEDDDGPGGTEGDNIPTGVPLVLSPGNGT